MKRAERQGDNIHTFNIDEEGQKINELIVRAGDFYCKAIVHILYEEPEGYQLDVYDPETGSFNY